METIEVLPELTLDEINYLRSLPYNVYLQSDWWRGRRILAYYKAGGKCQICGHGFPTGRYQVHHNNYDNLGCEQDIDLLVCHHACHKRIHRK